MKHWAPLLGAFLIWSCLEAYGKGGSNNVLYAVAAKGDLVKLKAAEVKDPKLLLRRNDLLRAAATHGQKEAVEFFLARGAAATENANPGLLCALAMSRIAPEQCAAVAEVLLSHGAKPDLVDTYAETPLQLAVERRQTQLAGVLLEHGADPNRRYMGTDSGTTSLCMAVRCNDEATVAVLLKFKASVDAVDQHGATPLLLAEERNETTIAERLRQVQPAAADAQRRYSLPPSQAQMLALAKRIAAGEGAALDELGTRAQKLYGEIKDYQREHERVMLLLFRMHAAFDALGEEAGRGNKHALQALKKCLAQKPLLSFAPDALGVAAAGGNTEALDILLRYKQWNILETSAQFALCKPVAADIGPAVEYFTEWVPKHEPRTGVVLALEEALAKAGAKGDQKAENLLAKLHFKPD